MFASRYPDWVVGPDIQYPDLNNAGGTLEGGRFIRGGSDTDVGTEAADSTAPNGLAVNYIRPNNPVSSEVDGGGGNMVRFTSTVDATVTGDAETAPVHVSGVWVVTVDSGVVPPPPPPILVMRQDITGQANFFTSLAEANNFPDPDPATAVKYSITDQVETMRRADGELEFRLTYFGSSRTDGGTEDVVYHWTQTSNPFTDSSNWPGVNTVVGFQAISASPEPNPDNWGGLANTGTSSSSERGFYNSNPGESSWWGTVAMFGYWTALGGGIPAMYPSITATAYMLEVLNAGA